MHLSISEQCSIDQPRGIRQAVELLSKRLDGGLHDAHHASDGVPGPDAGRQPAQRPAARWRDLCRCRATPRHARLRRLRFFTFLDFLPYEIPRF